MQDCAAENTIAALRRFNRFYTGLIGALDDRFLGCDVTLPEARLLYEIASQEPATASAIQAALGMDAGYVSRIVARFGLTTGLCLAGFCGTPASIAASARVKS